jgi:hypothetical protein
VAAAVSSLALTFFFSPVPLTFFHLSPLTEAPPMPHNYEASGSCGGYTWPSNLNTEEAQILANNNILVPLAWHLPHGWHVSTGGYTVAPIPPKGPLLDDYIELPWAQRDLPEWALIRPFCITILSQTYL